MWRNMNNTAGGRPILGTPLVGLLGSQIMAATASGPNGAGAMFNDGLEANKLYRMLLADPIGFPGVVYEDGSIEASSSFGTTYQLYEDNILVEFAPGNPNTPLVVTIGSAPIITAQPQNRSVAEGQSAVFSVTASGAPPLSYQWRRNGANIAGATQSTYTLFNVSASDSGASFSVVVSSGVGSVTSSSATLTVSTIAPPGAAVPDSKPRPWNDIVFVRRGA